MTNNTDPIFANPNAPKGGVLKASMSSFPLTLRPVGPDANHGFRDEWVVNNTPPLVVEHPNTTNLIPAVATHWAYGTDGKSMYFKINKKAKWSDGTPLTAVDYIFALEFMRSKHIVAPWYNDYYTTQITKVVKYDDHTISIHTPKVDPDLHLSVGDVRAQPKHFYKKITKDFVKKYNWKVVPNYGPYIVGKIKKGKLVELHRVKNWWGENERYFKGRFNVDKIRYKLIRDIGTMYKHFKKGNLSGFGLTLPEYWHSKAKGKIFDNGYVQKEWFYNDKQRGPLGFYFNLAHPILKDKNVRVGIAHAMNVDKVSNTILRGDYMRLPSFYVGYGEYSNNDIKPLPFDLKKAEQSFKKSGWVKRGKDGILVKDGNRMSFKVSFGYKHHTERLVILKDEAKKAGVEIELQYLDGMTAFKKAQEKKHEIHYTSWGGGLRPQIWEFFHSANANKTQTNNFNNYANKAMDKKIEKYRNSPSADERKVLSRDISKNYR